jgi:C4-dicarboxylate transporter DctQ subunit
LSVAEHLDKAQSIVNHLEEGLMAFLLAVMTLLTALQVILRYLFNTGLLWSLEATSYCFAWLVLLGMSYGVRTRSHIAVELLVNRFEPGPRRTISLIALLLCLVYAALMLTGAVEFVQRLFILGNEARDIPIGRWLLTLILPLGFGLLFLRFVQAFIATWRDRDSQP